MITNWHIFAVKLLMVLSVLVLLQGFYGCAGDPSDQPFVRLQENEMIQSRIFNRAISYAVLLPENYNTLVDSFPVVYLLHGFGDEYNAWYKDGLIQYYYDQSVAETGPMIFVMPQGFNSYYVNRYSGTLPYMDFFVTELVPEIDNRFRTRRDPSQRAVMGYSMGGYGALILPAKNPEIFSTGVPLSMSFRTDEQYMAEPQEVFDNQWGIIFGGSGISGESRLTNYFKEYSPFHFFQQNDVSQYAGLRIFLDCGDDEETLSVTSGALHNLMVEREISHEYRVRNGGHSWDYWHKSLPEALRFISFGFRGLPYPEEPDPVDIGDLIPSEKYIRETLTGSDLQLGIFKPSGYDTDTIRYPVIYFIHDFDGSIRTDNALKLFSLLNNRIKAGKIPSCLMVEIPAEPDRITAAIMAGIIDQIEAEYRIHSGKKGHVLAGNNRGGTLASELIPGFNERFKACFLFDAELEAGARAMEGIYYYIDMTDKSSNSHGNFDLYLDLREKGVKHEYRVRQGFPSFQSFLNGLDASTGYLSQQLSGN
ncbi:MAG TPA: alpha/beta hydrolase-fold protein [Bacteroidales bacterium]|nr:alpha/beta hydrolase-fold protein [Bacteroidales bacterium]HRZ21164.1 alpha/beta hydrolase-fold protein [Bacteroidales bacterium]